MQPKSILYLLPALFIFMQAADAQMVSNDNKVILNNEATINSESLEFSPAFYEDGIVFISNIISKRRYKVRDKRIGKNIMSIFRSRRSESGLLQKPEPFAQELLTPVHEGPLTFNRTNQIIYFTRNNYDKGTKKKGKDGIIKMQVFSAEMNDSTWTNVTKLSFNDDDANYMHPSIGVDDDVLYFSSDREGGIGGLDIYGVRKIGGEWGDPFNLGPTINTEGDEVFPFVHADGTLYFASNTHSGYGGMDIFSSKPEGDSWTKPLNLEAPFNTEADDFGLIVDRDKKNGYFSSNRSGGIGEDDIYSYYVTTNLDELNGEEPPVVSANIQEINVLVIDHETGDPIPEATVSYMSLDDLTIARAITSASEENVSNEDVLLKLNMDENSMKGLTDFDGRYPMEIVKGNYVVNVSSPEYAPRMIVLTPESELSEILVSLKKSSSLVSKPGSDGEVSDPDDESVIDNLNELEINTTISEGTTFELPNIYYNFNDASIRSDARIDLDALVAFLKQYPDIEIELASHTDSRGTDDYNNGLSQDRAENAVRYLVQNGIARERMLPVGYGEREIRNHCQDGVACNEPEHQYNRRTEVRITKIDKDINVRFINVAPETYSESGTSTASAPKFQPGVDYKVVAGVFSQYNNAERRMKELRETGFPEAEIINFGDSQLHSIVVRRFTTLENAREFSSDLKREHGYRSFIRQ